MQEVPEAPSFQLSRSARRYKIVEEMHLPMPLYVTLLVGLLVGFLFWSVVSSSSP